MDTTPPVVPARIAQALDLRGLHGPDVDRQVGTWEGNPAGDVDDWEAGLATPTGDQVERLAALCRLPTGFFYRPLSEAEKTLTGWACGHSGPNGGGRRVCHRITATPQPDPAQTARQNTLF